MAVIKINKGNFESEVLSSKTPVLLDFFANRCGSCRLISPIIDEIANEVKNAKIGKIDVDSEMELASTLNIISIPTLMVIKDGKIISQSVGSKPKEDILKMLFI